MSPHIDQSPEGKSGSIPASEYYRLAVEHVCDVISIHGLDGNFEFVSPSVESVLGYTARDLLGQSPYWFIHEEDAEKIVRPAHHQLLDRKSCLFRCRFRHKDGHWVWLEVTNDFVPGADGKVWKLITSSRDITLRKSLEDRIRMFENIVEVATDAIVVTDPQEAIIYVNPVFEQQTGFTFEEIRGKRPADFLQGPDSCQEELKRMRQAIRERRIGTFELKNYTKSGDSFFVRMLIQPLYNSEGTHEGFFALQQDITRERNAREEMKLLNADLKEKNSSLRILNKDLEEFAYIASHDLKEPLKNVLGLLKLLGDSAERKFDGNETKIMTFAVTSCERMSRMIENLLDYSRTSYPSEKPGEIRIREVLDAIRFDFSEIIAGKNATVDYSGPDMTIYGYPSAIHRLLQNLVSNSLKHGGDENINVRVVGSEHDNHWKISVIDNGPGIPKESQIEIFKLFSRLSDSPESTGIGLALCKRIAELHKGCIEVFSTPGKGTTLTVTISKHLDDTN